MMVQNDAPTDEAQNDHPAADVETLIVDPAAVIEMMRRNWRDQDERRSHTFRIHPPFTGEIRAKPHVSQTGNYYPPEMNPKPIHIDEAAFISGHNMDYTGIARECRFPNMHDSRSRFREEYDCYDENGANRRLTDEEEAEWEEWWDVELEVWEDEVRASLHDETVLARESVEGRQSTTVDIRYEASDE